MLDFPRSPIVGQEYVHSPYKYIWDGVKWKSIGQGSNPANDAVSVHEGKPNAHDVSQIKDAAATTGAVMTGNLTLTSGNNARLIANNNYIMGSNNAIILRDHGNGNVTLSGGVSASGVAGQLYLGYNAAQTGTAGFNTSGVRLEVPLSWKGASTIVNSAGKIPVGVVDGALSNTGTQTLAGSLLVSAGTGGDPISLTQTFNPTGANAQGISGYNSTNTSKRAWGVGAYSNSAVIDYAYLGIGESPWSNGIKVKAGSVEVNQPLQIGGNTTINAPSGELLNLNTTGVEGGLIRAKDAGVNDWYVGRANSVGDVALYSNKHGSGVVLREDGVEFVKPPRLGSVGTVFVTQHASTTDLNILSDVTKHGMYYQDANANATAARNYPIQEAGHLMVTGGAYGAMQEYTTFSTNRKFVRGKNASGSTSWRAWQEIGGIKDHCSAYRINAQTIASGATGILVPGVFPSAQGITSTNGDFIINRSGTYKVEWGFSIEPTGASQNGVGSIWINGSRQHDAVIYNYCPVSTVATQMGTASTSIIMPLNSGDRVSFRVNAVNGTSVRIYQAGYMTITQM